MAWLRRSNSQPADQTEAKPAPTGVRVDGPWDASERADAEELKTDGYIDLGSLMVKIPEGYGLQIPADKRTGQVVAALVVGAEGGLDLRVFAGPRSGGLWDEVRESLRAEVTKREGDFTDVEGPFGAELRFRVPAELASGEKGFQPSRVVGIDGPRWMLRATFLGKAAMEPSDEGVLMAALRDVVVVRGDEARPARELLPLVVPAGAKTAEGEPAPSAAVAGAAGGAAGAAAGGGKQQDS